VLIENMRREGFELSVSKPSVLFKKDEKTGEKLEPIEEVYIDIDEEFSGIVVEKLSLRKGDMTEMKPGNFGKTRLVFHIPSRGLIGYQGEFLTDTRGTGVLNRIFHSYAPFKGEFDSRKNGVLISTEDGIAVTYSLNTLEDRGILFVKNADKVYKGMVIGQHSRDNDLEVNPCKTKALTNMRASGKDESVKLAPPKIMSLEEAISYISDDELVEVTPQSIRIRKKILDPNERKKATKRKN
jgi:GTP-binding protein